MPEIDKEEGTPWDMDRARSELLMSERMRIAIEAAISDCVEGFKDLGFEFRKESDFPMRWKDSRSGKHLEVFCSQGIQFGVEPVGSRPVDPDWNRLVELTDIHGDPGAIAVHAFVSDLENGGFHQLLHNHGVEFLEDVHARLEGIGARAVAKLCKKALRLWRTNLVAIGACEALFKALSKLDTAYYRLDERVPAMYVRHVDRDRLG